MKRWLVYILSLFIGCFVFERCKKHDDSLSTETIQGQVLNLATDSGLVGVTVYLNINSSSGNSSLSTTTGANGSFNFSNVQIHSSNDYSYSLNVPTNGAGGYKPAIDGATLVLDKPKLNQWQTLHVVARMKDAYLYFPSGTVISSTDTVLATVEQKIVHKNLPSWNYQLTVCNTPLYAAPSSNFLGNMGSYWMGWWYSTVQKTKNGVLTVKRDSFYLGWGGTVTDTLPW